MFNEKKRFESGYSLIEALIVIAVFGVMAVITIPNSMSMLADYRLRVATQQVTAAIQLARATAVAENFNTTITCTPSGFAQLDTYRISGGEDDQNDGLDPWEDRNKNGIEDFISFDSETLPKGIRYRLTSVSPAVPVAGNPNQTTSAISFDPLGKPVLDNPAVVVYLENERLSRSAVTVDATGRVLSWRFEGGSWRAE